MLFDHQESTYPPSQEVGVLEDMEVPDNIFVPTNHLNMLLGSFGKVFKSLPLFLLDHQEPTHPLSQ